MMAPTHALVGFLLGAVAAALGLPAPVAAASAVATWLPEPVRDRVQRRYLE